MGGKSQKNLRYSLRHALKKVRGVKTWQLFLILVPLVFIAATFLRFDHIKMTELRSAVLQADQENNPAAITNNLEELRKFTFSHIVVNVIDDNGTQKLIFGTGPFYLENSYKRDAQAAIDKITSEIADDSNPNGNIYNAATSVCQPIAIQNGWTWDNPLYIECVTNELNKYPEMQNLTDTTTAKIPSTELYRYDFASPVWAPTWAGFTIILCLILIIVIITRIIIWLILRLSLLILKKSQKNQKTP